MSSDKEKWFEAMAKEMMSLDDNNRRCGREMFNIGVYVDDIVLAAKTEKQLNDVKQVFAKCFDIKSMGKLHYFLGMKVVENDEAKEVWIGQPVYTHNLLQKFGMENAKPVEIPVDTCTKLVKATEDEEIFDQKLCQSAVGSLCIYLFELDQILHMP